MIDKKHIEACLNNNRASQKLLYDTYSGQMYSICLRYCKDKAAAADALQIGFYKVFKNLSSYKGETDIVYWIKKIIVRASLDQIKVDKKHNAESMEVLQENDFQHSDLDLDFDHYNYDRILELIGELPEGYRIVFSLYVLDDFSHEEIAKQLNISASTSRSQIYKARKLLKEKLIQKQPQIAKEYLLKSKRSKV